MASFRTKSYNSSRDKVVVELSALVVMLAGRAVWSGQDHATDHEL